MFQSDLHLSRDAHWLVGFFWALPAQEMKHRAQVKQLKMELKSREAEATTGRLQLEEESLIIGPGEAYNEARSHRLDVYNESTPHSKRRKVS